MNLLGRFLWKIICWSWPFKKTHQNYSWSAKISNVTLVEKHLKTKCFYTSSRFEETHQKSKLFMKATKISNAILVKDHFLKLVLWEDISKLFMNVTKTTRVTFVKNNFLMFTVWKNTVYAFTFTMVAKTSSNVIHVGSHFLNQEI